MDAVDALKSLAGKRGTPPEALNDHGCTDGWIYVCDEDGNPTGVEPCAECQREASLARVQTRIQRSGVGPRYLSIEWADLEEVDPLPRIRTACERIGVVIDSGECALFHGKPGTGKTQAAVLLVKAAIRAGYSAAMENIGRLGMEIRAGYDGNGPREADVVRDLSEVDLLVLDDVGAGETNAALIEQRVLYLVTEARQNSRRPTIVTTNLSPGDLTVKVGPRIINRLQPLTTIAFAHNRNFRKAKSGSVW